MPHINNGQPFKEFCGINIERLLRCCDTDEATMDETEIMARVASLMHLAEPITEEEFRAAHAAVYMVEAKRPIPSC